MRIHRRCKADIRRDLNGQRTPDRRIHKGRGRGFRSRRIPPAGNGLPAAPGAARLDDRGDSWGTGIGSWNEVLGHFSPVEARLLKAGPLKASFVVTSEYESSRLIQEYCLYSGDSRVHCSARLLWNQPRCMLKLEFPVNARDAHGLFSAPYAIVERPSNIGEVPSLGWGAVIGDGANVGIAIDRACGFDIIGGNLRMSIVRSPGYSEMVGATPDPGAHRPFMDIGQHCFRYVLTSADHVSRSYAALNAPLQTAVGFPHAGTLPASLSVLSVSPESVELVAAKQAEDGSGWILRLWETAGRHAGCHSYDNGRIRRPPAIAALATADPARNARPGRLET